MLEEKDIMHAQICNLKKYVLKLKQNIRILNSKCYRLKNKKVTTNNKKIVCKNEIKNGLRHTHSIKMFALSLWNASPKCYNLLYKLYSLPSMSSIKRSIRMIDLQPGFNELILNGLRQKADKFTENKQLVVLAFDEMSLRIDLTYNARLDKVIGFQDLGENKENTVATYATVFMIKSLLGSWKQPVGYFFTSGPMNSDTIHDKLLTCITKLKECNLCVKVILCDQGPSNRGCKNLLNLNNNNSFIYLNNQIFFMYDPPHLIKSIRNALYNKGFGK